MKKIFFAIAIAFSLFILVLLVNTLLFNPKELALEKTEPVKLDRHKIISRLSRAIQLKTISHQESAKMDPAPFLNFISQLETSYPAIHGTLDRTAINTYSLLYKWPGKNPGLAPMALLAHYDVVPVEPGTQNDWIQGPFSGEIADGFIWGRGTLDMKGSFMAIMESIETLVEQGFSPQRTIYLAFGHDEEVGGVRGAGQIAAHLKKQGVHLSFTLDEGMVILDHELSPSKKDLAIIGIAEKGYATLKITATGPGGHSSMPTKKTTIGALGKAAVKLEENQMEATLSGPVGLLFDHIGPDLPFIQKFLFANRWVFEPLILPILGRSKTTNAMIRTTTALTMIQGGVKANVLPSSAHLLANFRILPGDTMQDVLDHAEKVINDEMIEIEIYNNWFTEPSPVSSIDTASFLTLKKTIAQVFPGTPASPGLVLGGTDSKHYEGISDDCYRFAPMVFGPEDTPRIHGTNERISVEGYLNAVQYYIQLVKNSAGP